MPVEKSALSPALEDYLESIVRLLDEKGAARVRDIARDLSVHESTVTAALKRLSEKDLVSYAPYELTTLTGKGRRAAEEVTRRHSVVRHFLTDVLMLDSDEAEANACRIEHVIDRAVLDRLQQFMDHITEGGARPPRWLASWRKRHAGVNEPKGK